MTLKIRRGRGPGRGRLAANAELRDVVRTLRRRLKSMEPTQYHNHTGDTSEEEERDEERTKVKFLKSVFGLGFVSKEEVRTLYSGSLNPEELTDWINSMNKNFEYAEMSEDKQVRFFVTKLRGHAGLWWHGVEEERDLKKKIQDQELE